MKEIKENDEVFIVALDKGKNEYGGMFNAKNYTVISCKVIGLYKKEIKVEFKNGKRQRITNGNWFKYEDEAKQYAYKIANNAWRKEIAKKVENDLPEYILPNFKPKLTGNPLRVAERNMAFCAQGNVFGSKTNEQKIIQVLAITIEDIEMLFETLEIIEFTNDYVKKLIGKYIIIELNSIFTLLNNLSRFNREYKENEYKKFLIIAKKLEEKYNFKFVRDKIGAHKDVNLDIEKYAQAWSSINEVSLKDYWEMIINHLEEVLMKYYPHEKKIYFLLRKQELPNLSSVKANNQYSYTPFSSIEV